MGHDWSRRCPECPYRETKECGVVPGNGPEPCSLALIGEGPGRNEDHYGVPFCGNAGEELNEQYLPVAGTSRPFVYVSNSVHCMWASSGDAPPENLVKSCAQFHLSREMKRVRPEVVGLMGATACLLSGQNVDLDKQHGIPLNGGKPMLMPWVGHKSILVPMYHPALGLHSTGMMRQIREDFSALKEICRGTFQFPRDPCSTPEFALIEDPYRLRKVLKSEGVWADMAIDTENLPDGTPWCTTFALNEWSAWMIRYDPLVWNWCQSMEELAKAIQNWRGRIYMHYALHDQGVLERIGFLAPWSRVYDTMQEAYHRGMYVQRGSGEEERVRGMGLKLLAYRQFGVQMKDFLDLVRPHSGKLQRNYMLKVEEADWPAPSPRLRGQTIDYVLDRELDEFFAKKLRKKGATEADGERKHLIPELAREAQIRTGIPAADIIRDGAVLYQPQSIAAKAKRTITDWIKADGQIYLEDRWLNWSDEDRALIEERLGPFPVASIAHVPFEEALHYACQDSRVTWMLGQKFKRMKVRAK